MDLAPVNLERFPYFERVVRPVRSRISEIDAQQDDTKLLVHYRDTSDDAGMLHNCLFLNVLAAEMRTTWSGGMDSAFEAVSIGRERRVHLHEAPYLQSGWIMQ